MSVLSEMGPRFAPPDAGIGGAVLSPETAITNQTFTILWVDDQSRDVRDIADIVDYSFDGVQSKVISGVQAFQAELDTLRQAPKLISFDGQLQDGTGRDAWKLWKERKDQIPGGQNTIVVSHTSDKGAMEDLGIRVFIKIQETPDLLNFVFDQVNNWQNQRG